MVFFLCVSLGTLTSTRVVFWGISFSIVQQGRFLFVQALEAKAECSSLGVPEGLEQHRKGNGDVQEWTPCVAEPRPCSDRGVCVCACRGMVLPASSSSSGIQLRASSPVFASLRMQARLPPVVERGKRKQKAARSMASLRFTSRSPPRPRTSHVAGFWLRLWLALARLAAGKGRTFCSRLRFLLLGRAGGRAGGKAPACTRSFSTLGHPSFPSCLSCRLSSGYPRVETQRCTVCWIHSECRNFALDGFTEGAVQHKQNAVIA